VSDISAHLRAVELRCFGRAHLQTVSAFGPVLGHYPAVAEIIFRHPLLDFATTHLYDKATIDNPKDTLGPALATGRLVREALGELPAARPFFDSEHGPIYTFNNRRRTLPEAFDDAYFRHMQWAHLAAGGAGGGLRWPYRQPHVLTHGMRAAQQSLAAFAQLLDWPSFRRRNLNREVRLSSPAFAAFACGDAQQAVVWLLRQDRPLTRRATPRAPRPLAVQLVLPGLSPGPYLVQLWDTAAGQALGWLALAATVEGLRIDLPAVGGELALAVGPALSGTGSC
jgi:mannan endo-1,4-beta-mannosidase